MKAWSGVETASLDAELPRLLDDLECASLELRMRAVSQLLVNCLPHAQPAGADHLLLRAALCAAERNCAEALSLDAEHAQTDDAHVANLVKVATETLDCVDAVSEFVLRAQLPGEFPSAATSALRVIQQAVTLCQREPVRCATLMRRISASLQALLAALGDEPVPPDDDASLLAHAQIVAQLAAQLDGLDVAAMAHAWKSFARLAQRHAARLRGELDVATPIERLAGAVCTTLADVQGRDAGDRKAVNAIKVAGFSLKLVIRLCEEFVGFLGSTHATLVRLLAALSAPRDACALDAHLEGHLGVGVAPLLAALLPEPPLVAALALAATEGPPDHLAGVLVVAAHLCLACARDSAHRLLWQEAALDAVLSLVDATPPSRSTFHLATTHVAALLSTASPHHLARLELRLVAAVARPAPRAALLAADVIVVASRLAHARLARQQVCHLAAAVPRMRDTPGRRALAALAARLFRTLPDSERYRLLKRFPVDANMALWEALGVASLPARLQPSVREALASLAHQAALGEGAKGAVAENIQPSEAGKEPAFYLARITSDVATLAALANAMSPAMRGEAKALAMQLQAMGDR